MPQASYPTALELEAWLEAAGFSEELVASLDLEAAMAAGIRGIEERTGRTFLPTEAVREFDLPTHPRGVLDLRADLISASEVSVLGTAQTAGTGYRLLPTGAADRGRPYAQIQFARWFTTSWPYTSAWGAVSVDGEWGWPGGVPDDVWQAMLMAGALALFPQIARAQSGGLESWSEADVTERYGSDPLGFLRTNWRMTLYGPEGSGGEGMGGVIGIYRRVTVG